MQEWTLAEVLALPDVPLERYPIRNREPRVQMGGRKWHLIYERDGGVCWMCGRPVPKGSHHVDHLIPRSNFEPGDLALGDRSDNLAVACAPCNEARSNWSLPEPPRRIGVTSRCWDCTVGEVPEDSEIEFPDMTVAAYCGHCGHTWVPDNSWVL